MAERTRRSAAAPAPKAQKPPVQLKDEERLQKLLARSGPVSRRGAEDLIREGRVTVNGQTATIGQKVRPNVDAVKVDGKQWRAPSEHRYVLVHKPPGMVTTREDPEGRPTVLELLPPALRGALFPVGRLDYQTQGLLLLTTDGELAHRLTHPRFGCVKTYEVKVKGEPDPADIARLSAGIVLDGRRTAPARIRRRAPSTPRGTRRSEANSWWQVELREGRSRQIREMFHRVGHPVQRLRRVAIGPLRDDRLLPGSHRELTDAEVAALRRSTAVATRERGRR
jgi:23S rRNA pseudouridine2605 synthase